MSDFGKIYDLQFRIGKLLKIAGENDNTLTAIEKDLVAGYLRDMYELVIDMQPVSAAVQPIANNRMMETQDDRNSTPLDRQEEIMIQLVNGVSMPVEMATEKALVPPAETTEKTTKQKNLAVEPAAKEAPAEKKSISEIFAEKTPAAVTTLNDKYKIKGKEIADALKLTPIKDLKTHIGLNKRINFVKSLFNGDDRQYEDTIAKVNGFNNYDEALTYLQHEIVPSYQWQSQDPWAAEFFNLVMRRYLN